MSLTGKDRKLRSKNGKTFPDKTGDDGQSIAETIAAALKSEFGRSPGSVKAVGRLTQANGRAVKNWFDGNNAPSGDNLVCLLRHSDSVLNAVLLLAGREELLIASRLIHAHHMMRALVEEMDRLRS
jgi:hypothetical protein